jgi:stage 0 sporulation regulatory protein
MSFTEVHELEDRINQLKEELIRIALTTGLNSHDTLSCSQKLDKLITIYQNERLIRYKKFNSKSCMDI